MSPKELIEIWVDTLTEMWVEYDNLNGLLQLGHYQPPTEYLMYVKSKIFTLL